MEKFLYSMSEVAGILGESNSLVRFWSNTFSKFVKPQRNGKGNRLFTKEDVETLKQIHVLVKTDGMSLAGAAKELAESRKKVKNRVKVLDSLKEIRSQLDDVKKGL
ncbi:MAG: MerR family transcriptional regulator [Bacteroidales bacterium]|jgi:DNA-binding transcriptional MerR regulator|nr:MerR family transcriptional regulator [Bacteroidales bacterium]MCI1785678.1 MerR family transcriptional regulator [Bacteroidales bacterium]